MNYTENLELSFFSNERPKPFLKWAGGKSQIIHKIEKELPIKIKKSKFITNYIEPFVGGGAFFFFLKSFYHVSNSVLIDINRELILCYKVVQKNPNELIKKLKKLEEDFLTKSAQERKEMFYNTRSLYNGRMNEFDYENYNFEWITRAAETIFLNKTCFNGLFRQNKKGEFNVPMGSYKNPKICNEKNIIHASYALKDTQIILGDFTLAEKFVTKDALLYYDPPYRPINKTSSFKSYSKDSFEDEDQIRLAEFFKKIDKKGAFQILSNSDPKNENPEDNFFDELYKNFNIKRIEANRMINCNGKLRGKINEIIITNY